MSNNHLKALIIASLGVLLMSLESLFIKLTTVDALTFAFYVGIMMFVSLNAILFFQKGKSFTQSYQGNLRILFITGFLFGTSNIFFISAIKTTSVANVVLILSAGAIIAALFEYLLYRKKAGKNIYISSFFIFIGLMFIIGSQLGSGELLGNIYAIICASFFSCAFVLLSRHTEINRFAVAAIGGVFSTLGSALFLTSLTIDLYTLMILACMGLFISPISRVLVGLGTKTLPGSEVSLLMIIETVMAPVWVWLFLKEVPSSNTFIGGSIIIITLIINSFYIIRNKKAT